MEKLQAALSRAREKRQASGGVTFPPVEKRQQSPSAEQARWDALTPFDVPRALLHKHRVVTREVGEAAAPFDILRTKILVQMQRHGWKRIAITSPMPRTGKTTTSCNLALGLGRQHELRSILMDLDLRDPSVHDYLETTPEYGVSDVLTGKVDFADQAMCIGGNVAVSMAREAEEDPARLLNASETVDVLSDIEARYNPDLMIFDLPSVLVNDETRAFLKNVDCALIVIRASVTRYAQFDICEQEIAEQTNVLGTVLNAYMSSET